MFQNANLRFFIIYPTIYIIFFQVLHNKSWSKILNFLPKKVNTERLKVEKITFWKLLQFVASNKIFNFVFQKNKTIVGKNNEFYKVKSLKIFSSVEYMADAKRKYRTVFEREEINYLRFEFSFYNKLFDEKKWKAKFALRVVNNETKEELCNLDEEREISEDINIYPFVKSWGVKKYGGYWQEGYYSVEAYIDGEKVAENVFLIHDFGLITQTHNPYFEVVGLRLYEGDIDGENPEKYYTVFKKNETRYVWYELSIKNKLSKNWGFEYFVNFYDDAGQLKASIEEREPIEDKEVGDIITLRSGWGNDDGNSFLDDKYLVNIVFMDVLVASVSFEMGDEAVEGEPELLVNPLKSLIQKTVDEAEDDLSLTETTEKLFCLIGLDQIKKQISEHIKYIKFLKLRVQQGFEENEKINLHSVFTGNPGTGKTTVVKLLGKIYRKMGLLSVGHVLEVGRNELVGEYIGQTAPKTKKIIEKARGGILFIDEAYSLARKGDEASKDYGMEVIELLMKEMSDGPGNIAIMVAGYPDEMEFFLEANPGLKSRFKYFFNFPDYTPDELIEITDFAAKKRSVVVTPEAKIHLRKILTEAYRNRNKNFGNARYAYSLIDQAKMNMGLRLVDSDNFENLSQEDLSTIIEADVLKLKEEGQQKQKLEVDIDEDLLHNSVNELNELVGLENVKNEIIELTKLVRYYREINKDVLNSFSMHTVFTGNPGTGKTTVARILGNIYKALGLLERGHVTEIGREGLIAGYVGQTGIKTKEIIDKSMGGVLFIDEAYGLTEGGERGYGSEAIEVILKNMEDNRGKFAIIAAGYPDNMNRFMKANPGLMSRFDKVLHFKDYPFEQLLKIADLMLEKDGLFLDEQAREHLSGYLSSLYNARDKYFGNAREVRKITESIVKKQNIRMANAKKEARTDENIKTIILSDVEHLKIEKQKAQSFGFR